MWLKSFRTVLVFLQHSSTKRFLPHILGVAAPPQPKHITITPAPGQHSPGTTRTETKNKPFWHPFEGPPRKELVRYSLSHSNKWTQVALMLLSRSVARSVLMLSLQGGPRGSSVVVIKVQQVGAHRFCFRVADERATCSHPQAGSSKGLFFSIDAS